MVVAGVDGSTWVTDGTVVGAVVAGVVTGVAAVVAGVVVAAVVFAGALFSGAPTDISQRWPG